MTLWNLSVMKDKRTIILGLSFFYHDAAAALLIDGKPIAMSEEERFSRKKHDSGYPKRAIQYVLETAGIRPEDLDYVVFYEKPHLKFERIIKTAVTTWPLSPRVFASSIKTWLIDKLWVRSLITQDLKIDPSKILFSGHHLSHAASAFLCSPYKKAAILTIDGVGEWASASLSIGEDTHIQILKEIHFPHSLGLLYSTFTAFLGFEVNEGEYKVMGMAPYGQPKYADKVRKLITQHPDSSFELNLEYFDFHRSIECSYSKKFLDLFGKPRDPRSHFFTKQSGWPEYFGDKPHNIDELAQEQEYYADIAASIQLVTEELVIHLAKHLNDITQLENLCYAGGVALNSVANTKILQQTNFKNIYIQPAAGDSGGALGAALHLYHSVLGHPRDFVMSHGYWGIQYRDEDVKKILENKNIPYQHFTNTQKLFDSIADYLASGKVVGWFRGRTEWGPRALGSRSILGDPRNAEMKNIVNVKIKFREPYRPFAPSVLAERAEEFFDLQNAQQHYPARFMLYVVNVKEEKKAIIPAVTHVDGTARLQTVFRDTCPDYWGLINSFYTKTGVPLLLNTSFNLRGEPIVNSPEDAISTFERSGLDVLVLENFVISK